MSTRIAKNKYMIGLTMGDPAGIGPEIAIKALASKELPHDSLFFIIGDLSVIEKTGRQIQASAPIHAMKDIEDIVDNSINILDMQLITPKDFITGEIQGNCGKAAYTYILKGIDLAKKRLLDAVVTCPINKASLKKAEVEFPGHTEIFAHETGTDTYSMMFMLEGICVTHVTTHCSLRQAIDLITREQVYKNISLLNEAMISIGIDKPKLAVGGLNPHAGEGGLFGNEEVQHINPAISQAQKTGIDVTGPLPPDTVFIRAFKGEFNGIVSMLHDHGFVALKSRDIDHSVNVTIGLPIIRTSVGHGTAFDIAGRGKASERSLITAIKVAYQMCLRK